MSMDLFLTCIRDGEGSTFTRAVFEEVMGRDAIGPKFPLTSVRYADGGCNDIDGGEGGTIQTVSFVHFGGETFYDRLWELADRSGSYLMWPNDGPALAVTRAELVAKIDPKMVEELGPPVVARTGKDLGEAIEGGGDFDELDE